MFEFKVSNEGYSKIPRLYLNVAECKVHYYIESVTLKVLSDKKAYLLGGMMKLLLSSVLLNA